MKTEIYEGLIIRSGTQDRGMVRDALYEDYPYANCKGHVVLDCGAHVGAFTKRALDEGAKRVISVEPWSPNLTLLKRNHGKNPNVEILPIAISNESSITLTIPNDRDTGAVSARVDHRKPTRQQKVKALTLEALIEQHHPTLIKMDIEGAEWDVLPCKLDGVKHICGELHTMSIQNRKRALEFLVWIETQGFYLSFLKGGPQRGKMFERLLWMHFHAHRKVG